MTNTLIHHCEAKNCTVFIFSIALSERQLLRQFLAHVYFNKFPIIRVFHIIYIIRDGEPASSFKSTVGQRIVHHCAALSRDAGLQLYRRACDLLTFQTLVRKLQNLDSAVEADLLHFCARC